ncbi:hypothetical protein GALMADRAFT_238106 [Galerina marginata CBS 339.88]|uniref:Uncharacterized protein n=1 Tax=Galerina marginata (strain CBS 339.88) TaxID=685588 RepID=A0A067TUJ6_GALM3|nr:hypothetical protein GALMADRAFT_238106 [Galerina marginata CBS 339.88]
MANDGRSLMSSLVHVFTQMANTPLVELESSSRPTAIPLKTFSSRTGPSFEFYSEFTISSPRHSRRSSLDWLDVSARPGH